jgi:hypothetical protein
MYYILYMIYINSPTAEINAQKWQGVKYIHYSAKFWITHNQSTNSKEQSSPWEANSHSATQEIHRFF